MSKLNKIITSIKEKGLIKTIKWLYETLIFRIKMKKRTSLDFTKIENTKDENTYSYPKILPNVFIVASIPYYDIGGGQRCSQLAKTFNKMGYNVIYLYGYKSSESKKFNLEMPLSSHMFINDKTILEVRNIVKNNDLFIFEAPSLRFKDVLNIAISNKCKIVYENIDNWETSLGNDVFNESMLISLLKNSDLLVGTAKPLVEQLNTYLEKYNIENKSAVYLPNAVDEELFCGLKELPKPKDMITGEKTFLYYGSLWGSWFDWDLIKKLALHNENYSINIIGDYKNLTELISTLPKNIHFLGLKKQIELPNYLKIHRLFTNTL